MLLRMIDEIRTFGIQWGYIYIDGWLVTMVQSFTRQLMDLYTRVWYIQDDEIKPTGSYFALMPTWTIFIYTHLILFIWSRELYWHAGRASCTSTLTSPHSCIVIRRPRTLKLPAFYVKIHFYPIKILPPHFNFFTHLSPLPLRQTILSSRRKS